MCLQSLSAQVVTRHFPDTLLPKVAELATEGCDWFTIKDKFPSFYSLRELEHMPFELTFHWDSVAREMRDTLVANYEYHDDYVDERIQVKVPFVNGKIHGTATWDKSMIGGTDDSPSYTSQEMIAAYYVEGDCSLAVWNDYVHTVYDPDAPNGKQYPHYRLTVKNPIWLRAEEFRWYLRYHDLDEAKRPQIELVTE